MSLEIGLRHPLVVRNEDLKLGLGLKVLYISDIHLRPGNQERLTTELKQAYQWCRPDVLLLGGDLCDHPASLPALAQLTRHFAQNSVVGAVWGNHDTLLGRERVREAVTGAGARWLPDQRAVVKSLQLLGSLEQHVPGSPALLCSHYPTVFPGAIQAGIELVFAGHLHGWQIVLGQRGEYLYPGAWLSRWNGLRFDRDGSTMLVSRGVTDLLPIRWNCPREIVLASL